METLNQQARRLSSGTISSLTNLRFYSDIDVVRAEFVNFCDGLERKPVRWQDAWEQFTKGGGVARSLEGVQV